MAFNRSNRKKDTTISLNYFFQNVVNTVSAIK